MDLKNKICIVTGANSGIGKVTALEIAKMGATVIMVCRSKEKGEKALEEVKNISNNKNVELMLCDFASQKSIRDFAEQFKSKYKSLHILVNNAGLIISDKSITKDGIESTFAINHLGYFLLTNLLLDLLKSSEPSRIVNVSSDGHKIGHIDFDDLNYEHKKYSSMKAYCDSKLANILFTKELSKRLKGTNVTANCLHPGAINSNFAYNMTGFMGNIVKLIKPLLNIVLTTVEKGAETQIFLATSPEVEGVTGEYFSKKRIASTNNEAKDKNVAERLWQVSEDMVKTK
ncbi:MAG: SDR family oxidoreductase [Candidatus Sericytochromatia bacterium]|nr:SDR family oxidoreductase [Candidatus Sericytochromatia bacterium]